MYDSNISSFELADLYKNGDKNIVGESINRLMYHVNSHSYLYAYTLKDGGASQNPEDYGQKNVILTMTDESIFLKDLVNGSIVDIPLTAGEDYTFTSLELSFTVNPAKYELNGNKIKFSKDASAVSEATFKLFVKPAGSNEYVAVANYHYPDGSWTKEDNYMPKFVKITDKPSIEKYGGDNMYFAPPMAYDEVMRKVPYGKVITVGVIRDHFAKKNNADFTDPITAGIFTSIVAWVSYQRDNDETPYWRTLKANGELNPKYPEGIELQKKLLEQEGHTIIQKGRTNIRYYVKDYEKSMLVLE